jgi:hypothetical protein
VRLRSDVNQRFTFGQYFSERKRVVIEGPRRSGKRVFAIVPVAEIERVPPPKGYFDWMVIDDVDDSLVEDAGFQPSESKAWSFLKIEI